MQKIILPRCGSIVYMFVNPQNMSQYITMVKTLFYNFIYPNKKYNQHNKFQYTCVTRLNEYVQNYT